MRLICSEPYALSKKLAEQAAWDYVKKQQDFELVTIIPGAISGPLSSGDPVNQPTTIKLFRDIMLGMPPCLCSN
jgi:nucleoside-diphosphate-sugar epimerase